MLGQPHSAPERQATGHRASRQRAGDGSGTAIQPASLAGLCSRLRCSDLSTTNTFAAPFPAQCKCFQYPEGSKRMHLPYEPRSGPRPEDHHRSQVIRMARGASPNSASISIPTHAWRRSIASPSPARCAKWCCRQHGVCSRSGDKAMSTASITDAIWRAHCVTPISGWWRGHTIDFATWKDRFPHHIEIAENRVSDACRYRDALPRGRSRLSVPRRQRPSPR